MALRTYHYVWLDAHSDRTEAWLQERLADGFDIHHLDGDRKNNDPSNLVLIEHLDHTLLHHGRRFLFRSNKSGHKKRDVEAGCYADWSDGLTWKDIQMKWFPETSPTGRKAENAATRYARRNGLRLPI